LEEAEEMPDFDDWDKVKKSIRALDVRNLSVLLLNPTTKTHWIYEELFEGRGVHEGFNGVKGNVLYIHTTYHDMPREFIPDTIYKDFEDKRLAYEAWIKLTPDERQVRNALRKAALYYKHVILAVGWRNPRVLFSTTGLPVSGLIPDMCCMARTLGSAPTRLHW